MTRLLTMGVLVCVVAWVWALPAAGAEPIRFEKTVVDTTFRSEGVATGDINHDGKTDIFAGDVWFEAPDWKMHELRKVGKYKAAGGYSQCFANFSQDVNGDGWIDSIVVGYPGQPCLWYENPKNKPGHWKERTVCKSACNETPVFVDLLGDGKGRLLFGTDGRMTWYAVPKDLEGMWDAHPISGPKAPGTERYSHGLGMGDVNGDGRNDVIVTSGWWEAPADRTKGDWTFHKAKLGPNCADMHAYDVDGDGDNDVISSSAHAYGMWWHEQVRSDKGVEFKQREIHKAFSQPHALHLVDVNGDGLKDLVTGKRYFAHHGRDPGGKEPAVLYWFELRRPQKGQVEFIPHKIDDDSGVGTQFEVTDFNGDGKLDIVTSKKKGVYLFIQK
ncbi:MAG: VCBS repeat-containing protein [Phycisphaerae bacterium]